MCDDPPARLGRTAVFPVSDGRGPGGEPSRTHAVVGAAGRAQPKLVDALHRLCDGRPRTCDSIHVPPRRLSVEKENEMKKMKQWLPLLLTAAFAAWFLG